MVCKIGTSGWQYRHWRGAFYPDVLPVASWLAFYAASFDTVEVNHAFYRLPAADGFEVAVTRPSRWPGSWRGPGTWATSWGRSSSSCRPP